MFNYSLMDKIKLLDFCKTRCNVPYRSCPYRMYGDLWDGQYIVNHYQEYRSVLLSRQKRPIVVKNALDAACAMSVQAGTAQPITFRVFMFRRIPDQFQTALNEIYALSALPACSNRI